MYLGKPSSASGLSFTYALDFSTDCATLFDILVDVRRGEELLGKKLPKRTDSGPIGVGSQWVIRYGPFGIPFFKNSMRITKFERPRRFARSTTGSLVGDADFVFEPISTGTKVTVTLEIRRLPWLVDKAAVEGVQRVFLTRIKEALEQQK